MTVTALQIAVGAMALNNQEIVLNKVKSLNETTSKLIKHNAERLKTQGVEIHKQAAEATLKMEDLEKPFRILIQQLIIFLSLDRIHYLRWQRVLVE